MTNAIERLQRCLGLDAVHNHVDELSAGANLDYAVDRFCFASRGGDFGPDQVVLLRQAVRWSGMSQIRVNRPEEYDEQLEARLTRAGIRWSSDGFLSAEPYQPNWLDEDVVEIGGLPVKRGPQPSEAFLGEPYLKKYLDFDDWLSPAQKEATWFTLTAPLGSTRTTVLPTGCGKSSSFWMLPTFTSGLSVVIVPTVALAMDQCQNAKKRYKKLEGDANPHPIYFAADENRDLVVTRLKEKKCRLVFASPETCVSGVLRGILNEFAKSGWFQNLVIDEAHIIETWGAEFRVEFQILGAARQKWKASNPDLRTFLFSATMSPRCRKTLEQLFSDNGTHQEYVCQRLRPEMSYYSRKFSTKEDRWPRLQEALWRLPRPAILYTTEPSNADALRDQLRDEIGFERIGCFTGETNRDNRQQQLDAWKSNEIDLMVATSAFGLGMDKSDVRTIIHACYPENLDRYYQEVGRGGRDGFSSICLLMPIDKDKRTAKALGVSLLRDENIIRTRWQAMYQAGEPVENDANTYRLPVEARGGDLLGARTFSEHIKWNKRLLLMLHRAGYIKLKDLYLKHPEDPGEELEEWVEVEVLNFAPMNPDIGRDIQLQRNEEVEHFNNGFETVEDLFNATRCAGRAFRNLYDIESDQMTCGGCRHCRQRGRCPSDCPPLRIDKLETAGAAQGTIVESCPNPLKPKQKEEFVELIDRCRSKNQLQPLRIYCLPNLYEEIRELLDEGQVLLTNRLLYRIDPFQETIPLRCGVDDPVLFLHIGEYSEEMLEGGRGCQSHHLFGGVTNLFETNGRHIQIKYDCHTKPNSNAWLTALQ